MKESKFYNSHLDHWYSIATSYRKLTTTTTWQLRDVTLFAVTFLMLLYLLCVWISCEIWEVVAFTHSFLDSLASTNTLTCVFLSSLVQQLNDHQALREISFLIILIMCEGNHLSNLTRNSHTQQIEQHRKRDSK